MSRIRSLLFALSPRRAHLRLGAVAAVLGCVVIAAGLASSPVMADTVSALVTVGSEPNAVAVNPASDTIYVSNPASGTLSVIDGSTGTVTATVAIPQGSCGVAYDPANDSVYVADEWPDQVSVIDAAFDEVVDTVQLGPVGGVTTGCGVVFDPVNDAVYVSNLGYVWAIDGYTNQVTARVSVPYDPASIAIDPDTNMLYTASYDYGNVTVINGYDNQVTDTIPVGHALTAIAEDPATGFVYATSVNNAVSVIDEATNAVTDTLPVGPGPWGVAVDPDTFTVYVTNSFGNDMSVIDEATDAVTGLWWVGGGPSGIAIDPATGLAYITDAGANTLAVINTDTSPPGSQAISFDTKPPVLPAFGSTYTVSASGGGSGNPVALTIDASSTSVCSISGSTVTFNNAGSCIIDANQAGNATYSAAQQAQQAITVPPEAPTLKWLEPANITTGTALTGSQLDATASVPGTFTYSPTAGTVLALGPHTLTATFTPNNSTDYTSGTVSTLITVVPPLPGCLPPHCSS